MTHDLIYRARLLMAIRNDPRWPENRQELRRVIKDIRLYRKHGLI